MSSHSEVIHVYVDIDIDFDFDLIDTARDECDDLNLNITDSFKIFRSEEKCVKIINFLKNKMS